MKLFRTWFLGVLGLLILTSCGLFGPRKPYHQGDRPEPLVLDQQHPERRTPKHSEGHKPIDYVLPWRLVRNK
jgi:hypothetical protein